MTRVLAFAAMLILCFAPSASASPVLVDESPNAGSAVSIAPQYVRLTFDRPIAGAGPYSITVTGADEVWSEPMLGVDETVLTVPLRASMPAAEYLVSYEVTPPDGATVRGQYRFSLSTSSGTPIWVWALVGVAVVGALLTAFRLASR